MNENDYHGYYKNKSNGYVYAVIGPCSIRTKMSWNKGIIYLRDGEMFAIPLSLFQKTFIKHNYEVFKI